MQNMFYNYMTNINYLFLVNDFYTKHNSIDLINMFLDKPLLIQYVFYVNGKNKYNLTNTDFTKFSNKDNLFYNCLEYKNTFKTHQYVFDIKTLKTLSTTIQHEVDLIITKNLDKGKENR